MKQVQEALRELGVPVYRDAYRPESEKAGAAQQYIVYVTMTQETAYWDDEEHERKTYVYMNLWSEISPTETARKTRAALRKAGFAMVEERTGSSGANPDYDIDAQMHCINWTWLYREEITDGAET